MIPSSKFLWGQQNIVSWIRIHWFYGTQKSKGANGIGWVTWKHLSFCRFCIVISKSKSMCRHNVLLSYSHHILQDGGLREDFSKAKRTVSCLACSRSLGKSDVSLSFMQSKISCLTFIHQLSIELFLRREHCVKTDSYIKLVTKFVSWSIALFLELHW